MNRILEFPIISKLINLRPHLLKIAVGIFAASILIGLFSAIVGTSGNFLMALFCVLLMLSILTLISAGIVRCLESKDRISQILALLGLVSIVVCFISWLIIFFGIADPYSHVDPGVQEVTCVQTPCDPIELAPTEGYSVIGKIAYLSASLVIFFLIAANLMTIKTENRHHIIPILKYVALAGILFDEVYVAVFLLKGHTLDNPSVNDPVISVMGTIVIITSIIAVISTIAAIYLSRTTERHTTRIKRR
ncbi:hypothetical protein IJ096_01270 [Candidatus Saccharibacteria bacterium]|nr:hypothetical protein [Candidatus Saccharibacteria bacterium]